MAGLKTRLLILHQNLNMAKTLARLLAKDYDVFISQEVGNVPDLLDKNDIRLVISSQQLRDKTGLAFFAELKETHPEIIRVLLYPKNHHDKGSADRAVGDGTLHRYMVEPLSSSGFVEMVHDGVRMYGGPAVAEVPVADDEPSDPDGDSAGQEEEILLTEEVGSDADSVEAASQTYASLNNRQNREEEVQALLRARDERIEQLEASYEHLKREKEDIQAKLIHAKKENAALGVIKREKEKLAEENSRGIEEIRRLEDNAEKLREQVHQLETELDFAHRKLDSFGILTEDTGEQPWYSARDLRRIHDPERIYDQAAEWYSQIAQLKRLHDAISVKNQRSEQEISELNERILAERSRHDEELGRLRRQLREYRDQIAQFRNRVDEQEARSRLLLKENEDLVQKLDWMQSQWKGAVASSSNG